MGDLAEAAIHYARAVELEELSASATDAAELLMGLKWGEPRSAITRQSDE